MTTPIPLTKPDGTVHAYACGNCGFLHCGWSHGGGRNEHDTDRTRTEAERCCTCHKCGAFVGSSARYSCEACNAVWTAEMAKRDAAEDAEHYTLTLNGAALDVAVEDDAVYIHATVRYRDADDPTRNRDWCESSRCGGASILAACADAASAMDAEEVTLVPKGAVVIDCQSAAVFADVCAKIVVQLDALSSAPNGMMTLMALRDLLRGGR